MLTDSLHTEPLSSELTDRIRTLAAALDAPPAAVAQAAAALSLAPFHRGRAVRLRDRRGSRTIDVTRHRSLRSALRELPDPEQAPVPEDAFVDLQPGPAGTLMLRTSLTARQLDRMAAVLRADGLPTLLGPADEADLLAWNTWPGAHATLHSLFEARADAAPDALAVTGPGGAMTYGELERHANRIAGHLLERGLERHARVGVRLGRTAEAVAAQLGVMKAGLVYVPIDASWPRERRRSVAEQAGLALTLTPETLPGDGPDARPAIGAGPADPAYAIFTSGSTGEPKGIEVQHGAIVSTTLARLTRYVEPVGRFLLVSPLAFDSAMAGLWWTLAQGGAVQLAPAWEDGLLEAVAATLRDAGPVTHTLLTPSLYREALRRLDGTAARGPRVVIVAGEACPPGLVAEHFRRLPGTRLFNEYGPTEAAVWCTGTELRPPAEGGPATVTIGTPIAGAELLVVDEHGRVLPPGCLGELWIGGAGLARGYLGRPELTADRFVPHPHVPGRRMYRSGDLGCWLPSGELELFGRIDDQLKVRGHRIEPAEIEHALRGHPGVADAVVALRDGRLTAYVVPAEDSAGTGDGGDRLRTAWTSIVDATAEEEPAASPDLDTSGWISSYTGLPIPAAEMAEWVDTTVARLREGPHRRVLELGCGTGMLLLRLAPGCEGYVGVDMSAPIVAKLAEEVARRDLDQVSLHVGEAAGLDALPPGPYDLIVCNSVTQYFPGEDYLREVVTGALRLLAPGGRMVVGDVRSRPLLDAFHASVAAEGGPRRPAREEGQLVVDPGWFVHESGAAHVEIRPRRGSGRDEMTRFRYDAVLHASRPETFTVDSWTAWTPSTVVEDPPDSGTLALRDVRNARITGDGVDPEALWRRAEQRGYRAHLSWAGERADGSFDVVLTRREGVPEFPCAPPRREYTNDTLRDQRLAIARGTLLPALRAWAAERLPGVMAPAAYVALAELPVTANGKVDRARLPAPALDRPELSVPHVPPRPGREELIAGIWSDLLGVQGIGADDDFFELGGHSLLAAQAVAWLGRELGTEVPLRALVEAPTVAGLAAWTGGEAGRAAIVPGDRSGRLPLAACQRMLWLSQHFRSTALAAHPRFFIGVQYRLSGLVDAAAMARAVDDLVRRHEALRTRMALGPDEGHQEVLDPGGATLRRYDMRGAADAGAAMRKAVEELDAVPLDPQAGRVLVAGLVTVSDTEHLMMLRVHHMACDDASFRVIERELRALYDAHAAGRAPDLPPVPVQFGDFARWEHERFAGDWERDPAAAASLAYWRDRARGLGPTVLPTDGDAVPGAKRSAVRTVTLPRDLRDRVHELARAERSTAYTVLMTCFQLLLAEVTGHRDLGVMTPYAGRNAAVAGTVVGLTADLVLIRTALEPGQSFREHLRRTGGSVRDALSHHDVPMIELAARVPELAAYLAESHFVAFEHLDHPERPEFADLRTVRSDQMVADYLGGPFVLEVELHLTARTTDEGLQLSAIYDPDLFTAGRIAAFLDRYAALVAAAATDPDALGGS
ncbi:amino acid adenylation domain-containing protein [Spirillospora sp. CA-253888]